MLNDYFGGYITVGAFIAFGFLLVGLAIWASGLIRPDNPNRIKSETYECGIDPVGGGWSQSHIRYYIFAFLFVTNRSYLEPLFESVPGIIAIVVAIGLMLAGAFWMTRIVKIDV